MSISNLICTSCQKKDVQEEVNISTCKKCKKPIYNKLKPGDMYCEECALELQVCKSCGKKMPKKRSTLPKSDK